MLVDVVSEQGETRATADDVVSDVESITCEGFCKKFAKGKVDTYLVRLGEHDQCLPDPEAWVYDVGRVR